METHCVKKEGESGRAEGVCTLLVSLWTHKRCLGPKALKVKLDLLEVENNGAPGDLGGVVDQSASLGDQSCVSCTGELAEKEEGCGAKRIGRYAGVRVVPA